MARVEFASRSWYIHRASPPLRASSAGAARANFRPRGMHRRGRQLVNVVETVTHSCHECFSWGLAANMDMRRVSIISYPIAGIAASQVRVSYVLHVHV